MRNVIHIPATDPSTDPEVPTQFTHCLGERGWTGATRKPWEFNKIVHLGKCNKDGDMFAAYEGNYISIYKGHLNSGKY